jgi:hypothetical protein
VRGQERRTLLDQRFRPGEAYQDSGVEFKNLDEMKNQPKWRR